MDPVKNSYQLCPANFKSCDGACYDPSQYHCDGGLQYGAEQAQDPTPAPTPTPTPTPTPEPTPTPSTSNSGSTGGSSDISYCPVWLTRCGNACFKQGEYCCTNDRLSAGPCGDDYCPTWAKRCGFACYKEGEYCCQDDTLTDGPCPSGAKTTPATKATTSSTKATTSSTSSTTKSTTSSTTSTTKAANTSPVVVNPSPHPNFPTQTADLRIINNCKTTLWVEGRYGGSGGPIPGQSVTATRALPGSFVDYVIPDTGLSGTRFWAKYGCDANGRNCEIGDQMQYWPNPPGGCPTGGCTPPIDSLFEATWGCKPGAGCNAQNPTTWFDTSQVDGWTIPYKLTPLGDTSKCDCDGPKCGFKGVDASTLDLARCPSNEDLTAGGNFSSVNFNGKTVSLKSVDLRVIDDQKRVIGCMSPCKKLNWSPPYGLGQSEDKGAAMWMCCPTPTPNNCKPSNGCVLPDVCRAGPIEQTKFVDAVHTMAPGVYSYSYDDGVGLHACPAGIVKYTMEFCPAGSSTYPLQL